MQGNPRDNPSFIESEFPPEPPERARFHVLPVPLEKTVSYGPGTARGPAAVLLASQQLEAYDSGKIAGDAGIHPPPPVDCAHLSHAEALIKIQSRTTGLLAPGRVPIFLGGEHSLTLPVVRALIAWREQEEMDSFGVVQFDAHADLRATCEGSGLGHACVMRRVYEHGIPIFQIGVRSLCVEEARFRDEHGIPHLDAETLHILGTPTEPLLPTSFPRDVYITFDVDAFDPSLVPSTGTPEPGGLGWWQAVNALKRVFRERQVIGCDIVELAPIPGLHAPDFTIAKLVYRIMGMFGDR